MWSKAAPLLGLAPGWPEGSRPGGPMSPGPPWIYRAVFDTMVPDDTQIADRST